MKIIPAVVSIVFTFAKLGGVQAATVPEMVVQNAHVDEVKSIRFSRDGRFALSVGGEELKLWNPHTGELIRTWIGQPFGICDAEFSPDGRTIVIAGADKGLSLWDVATGRSKGRLTASASCGCLKFSPDGKWLLGAIGSNDSLNGGIFVWNWQNHQLVRTLPSEKDDNPLSRGYFTSDQMGISRSGDQVWLRTYGHLTSWHFPDGKKESVSGITSLKIIWRTR